MSASWIESGPVVRTSAVDRSAQVTPGAQEPLLGIGKGTICVVSEPVLRLVVLIDETGGRERW